MAAPRDDDDVVVPLRMQPVVDRPRGWRGRSGSLAAVALAAFLVTALVLGRTLDDGSPRPSALAMASGAATSSAGPRTPGPSPLASPVTAAPPLPTREVLGGRIPDERRVVFADGVRVLDLATGTLEPTASPLYDQMLPLGKDQLVCACTLPGVSVGETQVPPSIRFGRYDLSGNAILQRRVVSLDGVEPVPDMTSGYNVTAALSDDGATLFALVAARRPPVWSIDLYGISVASGKVLGHATLGHLPVDLAGGTPGSPAPTAASTAPGTTPEGTYVWGNTVAAAPGGRTLYAAIGYVGFRDGAWTNMTREWMVPLRGDRPGSPVRVAEAPTRPDDWCIATPQFVDRELLIQACAGGAGGGADATYRIRRVRSTGKVLDDLPMPGFPTSREAPVVALLDRPGRAMLVWDPVRHALGRVQVDTGAVEIAVVPADRLPPVVPSYEQVGFGANPGLVLSPDGRRLYAIGLLPGNGPAGRSTGIWVFDARTLQLLDHWEALAALTSLAVSADGTFVYAAGAQGFDVNGNASSNGASVTVYDSASGEIQVVYGSVAQDTWITFPTWP